MRMCRRDSITVGCTCTTLWIAAGGMESEKDTHGAGTEAGTSEEPEKIELSPSQAWGRGTRPRPAGLAVLITGGSGRLGCEIAKLVYSHWSGVREIRLLDLVPPKQSVIREITGYADCSDKPKVSYCPGDILSVDALRVCFVKANVVIHCAAVIENGSVINRRKMRRVNVEGTRNVIDACLDCGVQALVFSGSLAQVFISAKTPVRFDETFERPRDSELLFPHYGGSKNAAEMLILEANERKGKDNISLHTCSLRCPPMYGESDAELMLSGLRMAKLSCGFSIRVGSTSKTMQSLYSGNAAWAHVLAAQRLVDAESRDTVGGNFYYIGDDSPAWSLAEYQQQFLKPFGFRQLPLIRIPVFLLLLMAYTLEFFVIFLAFFNIEVKTVVTRASVRWLNFSHSFSWEKARKDLQYQPFFDRNAAIARSVEYYRQNL